MAGRALACPSKKAAEEGVTFTWVDEPAFYLLPYLVRSWAPRGQTPQLAVKHTNDHLSAISGITLDGRLFLQVRQGRYDSGAVVGFLRVLLRKVKGRIILIWVARPPIGAGGRGFLASRSGQAAAPGATAGYAPGLNPDEGIWN